MLDDGRSLRYHLRPSSRVTLPPVRTHGLAAGRMVAAPASVLAEDGDPLLIGRANKSCAGSAHSVGASTSASSDGYVVARRSDRSRATRLTGLAALALAIVACGGASAPPATPAAQPTAAPAGATPVPTAAATPAGGAQAGSQADPCSLVTKAEAEALAGSPVTMERGDLPGPPGEGLFCRYTAANSEELEVRSVPGRGDYDNDRKSSDGFGNHPVDVPGIGDEAWADRGQLLGSINVIVGGHWLRISASLGFGKKPLDALPAIARQAIGRLP